MSFRGRIGSLFLKAGSRIGGRTFAAGRPTRLAGFQMLRKSINEEIRWSLRGLVAHSRTVVRNNDYGKAYMRLLRKHIIGPKGIRLVVQARQNDGTLDKKDNQAVEDAFKDWGRRGECTVCGKLSWLDVQRVGIQTAARDGNLFIRTYVGADQGKYGMRLQMLSIDQLDIDMNKVTIGGGRILNGIEMDKFDRVLAFWFFQSHPGDMAAARSGKRIRIPAKDMIHVWLPDDEPGQAMGIPWMHTALRRLNIFAGYEEAAIAAARVGASKMGFFTRDANESGTHLADTAGKKDEETGNIIQDAEPGSMEVLPDGYQFSSFDPRYPNGEMEPFTKVVLRGAAAGLGVAYTSLANDLEGANFSSMRTGLGEERDEWKVLQSWFSESLHEMVYQKWLEMATLSGAFTFPLARVEKFRAVMWRGRGWQAVNPIQEANANEKDMDNNLIAPQDIADARGESLSDVYEKIQEAEVLRKQFGITEKEASNVQA